MPKKMRELFRIHFEDSGKDLLKLLKYCREKPLSQFKALNCEQERITKKKSQVQLRLISFLTLHCSDGLN